MRRSAVIIVLFCFMMQISKSQELWRRQRIEAVGGIGATQFFGDVGGFSEGKNTLRVRDFTFLQTRYNLSIGLKYRILKDLNLKINFAYGVLHATDSRGSNKTRGFEATTSIMEPALMAEYYFIKSRYGDSYLFNSGKRSSKGSFFSALEFYTFLGIGGVSFNVSRNAQLAAVAMKNSGFAPVIPIGVGATLLFSPDLNLGLELGGRKTFTDYLDGYTSQHSASNDVYYFLNVMFTYKIKTNDAGRPTFLSKRKL